MDKLLYYIVAFFIRLFRFLPFSAVYKLSDFLSFVLNHVVKYRKSVIYTNLSLCFPKKSEQEIKVIADKAYTNLSDLIVESIKRFTMSFEDINPRYRLVNPEILDPYIEQGKNVIVLLNHYANWEWATYCARLGIKYHMVVFYKPLKNKYIDEYLRQTRTDMEMELVPSYNMQKTFNKAREKGERCMIILIADQNPSNLNKAIYADLFGTNTPCIRGPEKFAVSTGYPVFFANVNRTKRGSYELAFSLLFDDASNTAKGEVTQKYMKALEEMIRKKPEDWLWSHKRWKSLKIYGQKKK